MSDFPTLETHRLRLRELVPDDAPALFTIHGNGNAEAMRWYGTVPNLAGAEKLIQRFAEWRRLPDPGTRWGLIHREDGRLLGTCGLFKWNAAWNSCTLGYELAPEAWGRGYMREAVDAALRWGFAEMRLMRIEAQVHPDNAASIALLERLGFRHEGRQREAGVWFGQRHDLLHFGLLKREFRTDPTRNPS